MEWQVANGHFRGCQGFQTFADTIVFPLFVDFVTDNVIF